MSEKREVDRFCRCGHKGSDHAELGPCMIAGCRCEAGRGETNMLVVSVSQVRRLTVQDPHREA